MLGVNMGSELVLRLFFIGGTGGFEEEVGDGDVRLVPQVDAQMTRRLQP